LFKKWPEIFLDCPQFCVPGAAPVLYLIIKDADYYPVNLREVSLTFHYSGKVKTQKIELHIQKDDKGDGWR
jgi:hypothetical protein